MSAAAGAFSPEGAAAQASLVIGLVLAVIALFATVPKVFRVVLRAGNLLDRLVGSPEHPGIVDQLDGLRSDVTGITKELHPNGGSSLRDDIQAANRQAQANGEAAQAARVAAERVANELLVATQFAVQQRADMKDSLESMAQRLQAEMAQRTAAAYELLAEHGGPDLRLPVRPRPNEEGRRA